MMLAAAFRSWVRSSGSCMTSSRKPITLHLSSSLVSKSCREGVMGGSGYVFELLCSGLGPGQRKELQFLFCPWQADLPHFLSAGFLAGHERLSRPRES